MKITAIELGNGNVLEVQHTPGFIKEEAKWRGTTIEEVQAKDIKSFIQTSFKIALETGTLEKIEAV